MMILYDPRYANVPWSRSFFAGCYGDRQDAGLSSWVVPGTWPEWCQ